MGARPELRWLIVGSLTGPSSRVNTADYKGLRDKTRNFVFLPNATRTLLFHKLLINDEHTMNIEIISFCVFKECKNIAILIAIVICCSETNLWDQSEQEDQRKSRRRQDDLVEKSRFAQSAQLTKLIRISILTTKEAQSNDQLNEYCRRDNVVHWWEIIRMNNKIYIMNEMMIIIMNEC